MLPGDDFKFGNWEFQSDSWIGKTIAAAVAALLFVGIVAIVRTNFAENILPMSDEYLQAMVPRAADGTEALALRSLDHLLGENRISISGSVVNRTEQPLTEFVVVIYADDTSGRFAQTLELETAPPVLEPGGLATFAVDIEMGGKPARYDVKFKLKDGPVIPHREELLPKMESPK